MKWEIPKIWSGVCWILGGGFSVAQQFNVPATLIPRTRGEYYAFGEYLDPIFADNVIGVNVGAFVSDKIPCAFWGDTDTYLDFKPWFDAFAGLKVSAAGKFEDNRFTSIYYLQKNNSCGITRRTNEVSWCARNSAAGAISLAYHLGAHTIILLGIDLKEINGRVHWHTGYPDKQKTRTSAQIKQGMEPILSSGKPPFKNHAVGYPLIAKDAQKLGLRIINASPESDLTCFEKMSVQDALVEAAWIRESL
jgi:hypothetical protein